MKARMVSYRRLKEVLPTVNTRVTGKLYAKPYCSQEGYIDGFTIYRGKDGTAMYKISCFDRDPVCKDDKTLMVIDLLIQNGVELPDLCLYKSNMTRKCLLDTRMAK